MKTSMVVALKTLFCLLTCVMAGALVYVYATDFSTCVDLNAWWMMTVEADFGIDILFVMAWYFYKESSWIKRLLFLIILFWCGSFVTCGYIVMQLFKLSPEESSTDPLYFVLLKRQKGDVMGHPRRYSVVTAKVIVAALGCYMIGYTIHAYIVDGSPFHAER
nr:reverse transcriptase, RNA-dependent DNA polymerase [Tanacetum cinerariifolium]